MTTVKQASLAGGIISPNLYGRSDLAKWAAGLAECRNFWINRFGNAENRPGTEFCGNVKNSTAKLIPFSVNSAMSFILEIGNVPLTIRSDYMRIWSNGVLSTVVNASQLAYSNATTYYAGQIVYDGSSLAYISRVDGNLNQTLTEGVSWHLLPLQSTGVSIVEVMGPDNFGSAQFTYSQINQVLYIASQSFAPLRIEYHANGSPSTWYINTKVIQNSIGTVSGIGATAGGAGATMYRYAVSSVGSDLTTQGPMGLGPALAVSSVTYDFSGGHFTTSAAHNLKTGDIVQLSFQARTLAPNTDAAVVVTGASTFDIIALTFSGSVTFPTPGNYYAHFVAITSATPTSAAPNVISWTAATNAAKYNVYEYYLGAWSFIGSTISTSFQDINITPNPGYQPAVDIPMFQTANDWPAVVGVYQQRLWFANTLNQPQSYWASRTGQYGVFSVSTPSNDADAFTFTLAGDVIQYITGFSDIGKLIIHTTNNEYVLNGNQSGVATPTGQNVVSAGTAGSLPGVKPLKIGQTALFPQVRGSQIRDLQYTVQLFNYAGKDTTINASSLFTNKSVVNMVYQQTPNSLVWVLMNDGTLVAMTYIRDHEMWAWSRHDTAASGKWMSICTVPGATTDTLYAIVQRTINGAYTYNMERLWSRDFADLTYDACFTDSSLTYNGRGGLWKAPTGALLKYVTFSTSGGWTTSDVVTISGLGGLSFSTSDVTNRNVLGCPFFDSLGNIVAYTEFMIIGYIDANNVTARPLQDVPAILRSGTWSWVKKTSHFSGATNLAGQSISVLGDGSVETGVVVDGSGSFTTANHYGIVHAGLPITAQIQTLDWENAQGESIMGRYKNINQVTLYFCKSRGGFYGTNLNKLVTFDQRQFENFDQPNALGTGPVRIPMLGTWSQTAQMWIQQTDPLPLCISAIAASGEVGS